MTGIQFYDVISYKLYELFNWVIISWVAKQFAQMRQMRPPVRPSWRPSSRLSSASQFYTSLRLVDRICFFSKYFMMSSTYLSWSLMTKVKIFEGNFAFKLNMVYLWLKSKKNPTLKSAVVIRAISQFACNQLKLQSDSIKNQCDLIPSCLLLR